MWILDTYCYYPLVLIRLDKEVDIIGTALNGTAGIGIDINIDIDIGDGIA